MKKLTAKIGWLCFASMLLALPSSVKGSPNLPSQGKVIFSETFDAEASLSNWTIVNVNGGKTWRWFNGAATYLLDPDLKADDWLISPSLTLSADSVYELDFSATAYTRPENFNVSLIPQASTDTVSLGKFPSFTSDQSGLKRIRFKVSQTGKYNLGWFEYSEANMHRLEIDNVKVLRLSLPAAPDSVSNLRMTIDTKGTLADTLSFVAPALNMGGGTLSELSAIKIFRGDKTDAVKVFSNPAIGSSLQWIDTNAQAGFNTYYIYAENQYGTSGIDSVSAFVGTDTPSKIAMVNAKLNADQSITISWDSVQTTVHNGYLDKAALQYKIERDGIALTMQKGTTYTEKNPVSTGQKEVSYQVTPVVGSLLGETTESNKVVDGVPFEVPYYESFKNAAFQVAPWVSKAIVGTCEWTVMGNDEDYEINVQDGDKGMAMLNFVYANPGDSVLFISPILDISKMKNPKLTFYLNHNQSPYYDPEMDGEQNDRVQVQLSQDGGAFVNVDNGEFYNCKDSKGWTKCEVHLTGANAKFVNVGLLGIADNFNKEMYIDSISITNDIEFDLKADSLTGPKRVDVNTTSPFVFTLINYGADVAKGYSVNLFKDGKLYATQAGTEVLPNKKARFSFDVVSSMADLLNGESHTYQAVISYSKDEDAKNDSTALFTSSVRTPEYPVAINVKGLLNDSRTIVKLQWDEAQSIAAQPEGEKKVVTDGFDSYEPYVIDNIGNWSLFDRDGDNTLASPRMPDYPHKGEPMAYQVFNNEEVIKEDDVFASHSGSQYLIAPCGNTKQNDDWLVSPRLNGHEQTIDFWAKAATYDSERIIVYYSTTDKNPDSFIKLSEGDCVYVHDGWLDYKYTLPEGAKYFAVRYVSNKIVMLFLDDATYTAYNGGNEAMKVLGYNVYRNGEKLNSEILAEPTFVDNAYDKDANYYVTVVYDKGESAFSAPATINLVGLNMQSLQTKVYAYNEKIVIDSQVAQPITVCTVTGAQLYVVDAHVGKTTIAAAKGIYLVKVGDSCTKLVVE